MSLMEIRPFLYQKTSEGYRLVSVDQEQLRKDALELRAGMAIMGLDAGARLLGLEDHPDIVAARAKAVRKVGEALERGGCDPSAYGSDR